MLSVFLAHVMVENGNVQQTCVMAPAQFMVMGITLHLMGKDTLLMETVNTR